MVDSTQGDPPPAGPERQSAEQRPTAGTAPSGTGDSLREGLGMLRFVGAGMELSGSAILCAAIGYAVDQYFENTTLIATALGAVFGFAAALYRFIRMAMAANKPAGRHR